MAMDSKFVFIAFVVLATEIWTSLSDLKVKKFLAQVRPVLTDPFLLFLYGYTFRATLAVTAHARGVSC